jgi:microcystin-dependent protein
MADRISFIEDSGFKAFSGPPATTFYTGQIIMSGGTSVPLPEGWLWCDGSLFDELVYPNLATVLASNFDNGSEPSGFMRLPNFTHVMPRHKATPVGGTGGSKSHFHGLDTVGYALSTVGAHTHTYNAVNLSHTHNTNGFGTTSTAAHNHGVNGVSTGFGQSRTRANGNGTTTRSDHTHPVTQSNTAGGGDHNHGANGVSTNNPGGNHDHGGAQSAGGHSHTVFGAGIIFSDNLTNIPDVVSVNFMIRAL